MQSRGIFQYSITTAISLVMTACGGSSQPAKDPSTVEDSPPAAPTQSDEPTATGSGVDAEMQFEDKGESTKADRTPPPTPSYKPTAKVKPESTP